jgi:hypothetical protein
LASLKLIVLSHSSPLRHCNQATLFDLLLRDAPGGPSTNQPASRSPMDAEWDQLRDLAGPSFSFRCSAMHCTSSSPSHVSLCLAGCRVSVLNRLEPSEAGGHKPMQWDGEMVCCKTVQYIRKLKTSLHHRLHSQLRKQTAVHRCLCILSTHAPHPSSLNVSKL